MKTKLLFLSTTTLLIAGMVTLTSKTVSAAPETSTVTTTLKESSTPIVTPPIVTPTDPAGITDQKGPLSLDFVSPLDFGESEITTGTQTLKAQGTNKLGLQVTDIRGTGAGWKVDVALSKFQGSTNTIKGAVLTLPVGTLATENEAGIAIAAPIATTVALSPEGASGTVLSATKDNGLGTWFSEFNKETTTLKIPSGNYADVYSATLTWTLSNAI